MLAAFVLLFSASTFIVYANYDYIVFKLMISKFYIYTDTLDNLFKNELHKDTRGDYAKYFDDLAITAVTQKIRALNNDKYTYLYLPEQLQKYKAEEKEEAAQSTYKELTPETVYLKITNFSKYTAKYLNDSKDALSKYHNVIIDMRDNYGGDTDALYKMAGLYLPRGSIMSTDKLTLLSKTYRSSAQKVFNHNKIIILQNKNSASSAENFIAALKDNLTNVTLVGDVTYGKGIGQFTMNVKNGFAVKATVMKWFTPNGLNIQGTGIKPDIYYNNEDIINYALTLAEHK
jgi:Periplasmic protease